MAETLVNRQIQLARYSVGWVKEEDMRMVQGVVSTKLQEGSGDVLLRNIFISLDPYLRRKMTEGYWLGNIGPYALGQVMTALGVSQVLKSANGAFKVGDYVHGEIGWEDYTMVKGGQGLYKLPADVAPLSYFVGVLGMPGATAYFGLMDIGRPKAGETVYVSAASGAVGQIVGQLAKHEGCYVVGSAGSDEKVKLLMEKFNYDAAFNYKVETDFDAALKKYCPEGIDIYYENVGGEMLDAAINNMNSLGRIVACGMISQYNTEGKDTPVHNLAQFIGKQLKMEGFLVGRYLATRRPEFFSKVAEYVKAGKVAYVEDVTEGLERAPTAFIGMLKGQNVGKSVVRISKD